MSLNINIEEPVTDPNRSFSPHRRAGTGHDNSSAWGITHAATLARTIRRARNFNPKGYSSSPKTSTGCG
jgi:hypothetical protein